MAKAIDILTMVDSDIKKSVDRWVAEALAESNPLEFAKRDLAFWLQSHKYDVARFQNGCQHTTEITVAGSAALLIIAGIVLEKVKLIVGAG